MRKPVVSRHRVSVNSTPTSAKAAISARRHNGSEFTSKPSMSKMTAEITRHEDSAGIRSAPMKIAIIGRGHVGGTLAQRFSQVGHQVVFGVRNPEAGEVSVPDAAKQAELVLFATPWNATKDAVQSSGSLEGKIVVD